MATLDSTPLRVSTENIRILKESSSPRPRSRHGKSHRAKHDSSSATPRSARKSAAYTSTSHFNGVREDVQKQELLKRRNMAAVKIQVRIVLFLRYFNV